MEKVLTIAVILCVNHVRNILASTGDRSQMFYTCLQNCLAANCSESAATYHMPLHLQLLQWTCSDDCKYYCMWPTVDWFVNAGIGVQQFYGKWPFIRLFGIQEPAAMIFSLFNMACHLIMIRKFREKVDPQTPYYLITHLYCLICCHAWFWSAIFHIRDVRFTEIMDYLNALSMVLFSFYHFLIRLTTTKPGDLFSLCVGFIIGSYFVYHGYTVFFVRMDYGYNMIINIGFGAMNIVGWLLWCWKHAKQRPYVKQCALFTSLVAATTLLEVGDFPPIFWVVDAHALWHLVTSPLPILWYRFLIDDCHYLTEERLHLDKIA